MDAALKALAEPRRRAILRLVWSQELPATDIADRFRDVTRPAISQHLAVLKDADLVTERRDGTRRLYRANTDTMAELRAFLDDYWTSGLERLRDVAEAAQDRQATDERQELMAELVREIMIDATPETIWPFLTDPDKHVEWLGTVADIDPRPGGVYRVLVGGQYQSAGEYVEVVPQEKVVFTFGWDQEGHPIPAGLDDHRDHAAPRGRQDPRPARAPRAARRRDQRSRPRLGALPRPAGDRRDRRRRRARRAAADRSDS